MKKIILLVIVFMFIFAFFNFAEKPGIGVLRFTNSVAGNSYWRWNSTVARELQDMLISELSNTNAFSVLKQNEINVVFSKREISRSGKVSKSTLFKMQRIKGAKYLIAGTVKALKKSALKGEKVGLRGLSKRDKKEKIHIAIDVKIINTETGEIVDARTIEATIKAKVLRSKKIYKGSRSVKKTPTGKAVRACIRNISKYLVRRHKSWSSVKFEH